MKVSELIELLKTMPQDFEVIDFSYDKVDGCHINDEFWDSKLQCEIEVVQLD